MPQTRYESDMVPGFPGLLYSSKLSGDSISAINDDPRAAQVITFTVSAGTSGSLSINGITFSGAGTDNTEVAEDLADQINAEPLVNGFVIAENSAATVVVTARVGGIGFTFAAGASTSAAVTQANATAAPLPFGRAVLETGQAEDGELLCKLLDANTPGGILGISFYTATQEKARPANFGDNPAAEYAPNSIANILRKGRVYVATEGSVAVGDPVLVRHTADGALDQLGGFAGAAGTGLVALTNCRWIRGSRRGVAVLQVDFT